MSPEFFNQVFFIGQKNCLDAKHLIFADVTAKNMSASGASERVGAAEAVPHHYKSQHRKLTLNLNKRQALVGLPLY